MRNDGKSLILHWLYKVSGLMLEYLALETFVFTAFLKGARKTLCLKWFLKGAYKNNLFQMIFEGCAQNALF